MNDNQLEQFLRENKPQVKDDPAFILEARQKMQAVEGIKAEVDRQRRFGRGALIVTLVIGILAGAAAMALSYVFPVKPAEMGEGLLESFRLFLDTWKAYLMLPIAGCATTLGLVLGKDSHRRVKV